MPPKGWRKGENMATNVYGAVKQLVRDINAQSVYAVDQELDKWDQDGYDLFATHVLMVTAQGHTLLYVLKRRDP